MFKHLKEDIIMSLSKVTLANGTEFDLVANAVTEGANSISITFIPGDYTVEGLEAVWTGNDTIKVSTGDTLIQNYTGFTKVKSVEKINPDPVEEGEEPGVVTARVTLVSADLTKRVSDVEDAVEDLINAIL
jgi:hypothetical protein